MKKTKRIFISRDLSEDSLFHEFSKDGYEVIGKSLIEFSQIEITTHPITDWIFFYSKRGVNYYFNQKKHSTSNQYAVIGPGTAKAFYSATGFSPKFTGQGNPEKIADTFKQFESGQSILFVRARNSLNSLKTLLGDSLTSKDLVVYENKIKAQIELPKFDFLVFTSPLNVEAYLNHYTISDQKLVAIGQTTADYIEKRVGIKAPYCELPSERNLVKLLKDQI